MSNDLVRDCAGAPGPHRRSRGWPYIRIYILAVGFAGIVLGISAAVPSWQYNRASYVGALIFLLIVWSPVLLVARRRAFAIAAFSVGAVLVLRELGATLGSTFPVLWLVTVPLLVASLFPPPPPDRWTYGVLGAVVGACVAFAAVFAANVPVADTIVKLCLDQPASASDIDDALGDDRYADWISGMSYGPTAVGIQVRPYTPDTDIDALVARAESSPLFSLIDVGGTTPCRDAPASSD